MLEILGLKRVRIIGVLSLVVLAVIAGFAVYWTGGPEEVKTVQAARYTSAESFQTEIYLIALRELGYQTEPTAVLSPAEFYAAVGSGNVDFWASGMFDRDSALLIETNNGAQRVGYLAEANALQGYMIDRRSADAHGIASLADFKKPEIAKLFDTTGDGKANLTGCDPDGGCETLIEHHIDTSELRNTVDVMNGGYSAAMTKVIARHQSGEPVFFYAKTPSWTASELVAGEDVVWLEVPFDTLPRGGRVEPVKAVPGCANDPCLLGFPTSDIRVVANRNFIRDNIAARQIFEVLSIPPEDISAQNARMMAGESSDADVTRHAHEWVAANRALFDSWLAQSLGDIKKHSTRSGSWRHR